MARLTVKSVETAAPSKDRREIPDGYVKGLYLIVQPSGAKSWAVRYRHGGRPRKYTIGNYPLYGLKEARERGIEALRAASEGRDPAATETLSVDSIESAVEEFLERHVRRNYRPKPMRETERLLRSHVVEAWRGRRVSSIARADVRRMLDRIVERGTPIAANRVHSVTRGLFNWLVGQEIIAASPCAGLKAPAGNEGSRDRALSDDELCRVWQAADQLGPYGAMVRLLILTGQRRGEVAGMEWAELDLENRLWTLPRERVKNDRRHEVPLSPQAAAIIQSLPRIGDKYVFSVNGTAPANNFADNCARLRGLLGDMSPWVIHDLRRTVASGMARLGISLAIIEKVLNHVSGSFAGIVGVYQRHEFAEEKRAALEKWAEHVESLTARA
jgi:integrase